MQALRVRIFAFCQRRESLPRYTGARAFWGIAMLISILGALLAGCLVSWIVPFVPFAAALTAAVAIGAIWAGVQGHSLAMVALDSVALLFATQVGYALGLVLHAVVGPRAPSVEPSPTAAAERREIRDLRFGKES